jgi:U3 small nucleolar RNA-associated protein 6
MDAQGDMTEARSYMQRGLRFCKQSKELWLEYARLELIYILKIVARQKILGLDENRPKKNLPHFAEEFDKDYFALPIITAENINPHLRTDKTVDEVAFKPVISTPALLGAIALAIFDAAMGQFKTPQLGERFFDMIADFDGLPCQESLLQHIVDTLVALEPNHSATLNCSIRQPLIGVHCISAIFPTALSETLSRLKTAMEGQPPLELLLKTVNWQLRYLEEERLDSDIRKALSSTMSKTLKKYIEISKTRGEGSGVEFATILEKALSRGHDELRFSVTPMALEVWPASELLLALLRVV